MKTFLSLAYLFIFGGVIGYVIELFFRRFFSAKKWLNPGFLHGPFLPIYGFGLTVLYLLASINFQFESPAVNYILTLALMGICMTLIEYIAGIIFIKGMNIKLWDYSNVKGNIKGIICPLFSLIWLVGGAIYLFGIHPFIQISLNFFIDNIFNFSFFLGMIYGVLLIDIVISSQAAQKLSALAKNSKIVVSYEEYKLQRTIARKRNKERFAIFNSSFPQIKQFIKEYKEKSANFVGHIIYIDEEKARKEAEAKAKARESMRIAEEKRAEAKLQAKLEKDRERHSK
ncbi:MAG: hypothetical protein WCR63_00055 [Bacilli bacterium]